MKYVNFLVISLALGWLVFVGIPRFFADPPPQREYIGRIIGEDYTGREVILYREGE
jgi:hypothetical protein